MNLIDDFMMCLLIAGSPHFSGAQIMALRQTGVATADTHSAIQLAGIWNLPISMLAVDCAAHDSSSSEVKPSQSDSDHQANPAAVA
jgi:hypothetical protein